ncbi:Bax inhibitor-1/YccA family protein [Janibacter sp. G56]|uniref:Bax inhibitor-1/YccA family protein n=1 Tax=Janibacter sp. G56 TaxID=3418717 RepID=UPI003D071F41
MSNPILDRVNRDSRQGYAGFNESGATHQAAPQQGGYAQQGYPQQRTQDQWVDGPIRTNDGRGVTVDDVVVKTGILFSIVVAAAVVAWFLAPTFGPILWGVGLVGTLILGFVVFMSKTVRVPLIMLYAALEGVFVGAISQSYSNTFDGIAQSQNGSITTEAVPIHQGIVFQAVLATVCVFAAMLFLYKARIIKVTAKFRSVVSMMLLGYFLFALVNLVFALVTKEPFGIGGSGLLGIGISLFAVGLASVTLMLDFDNIEQAIRSGAPEKYSWLLAMGLIVTLVWLYLEILRLLGRLRSSD